MTAGIRVEGRGCVRGAQWEELRGQGVVQVKLLSSSAHHLPPPSPQPPQLQDMSEFAAKYAPEFQLVGAANPCHTALPPALSSRPAKVSLPVLPPDKDHAHRSYSEQRLASSASRRLRVSTVSSSAAPRA